MAHELVMLLTDDDTIPVEPRWHWIDTNGSDPSTLCTQEYFGTGQSECTYKLKQVKRGGITCGDCMAILKEHKAVAL